LNVVGAGVEVIATEGKDPVLVRKGRRWRRTSILN